VDGSKGIGILHTTAPVREPTAPTEERAGTCETQAQEDLLERPYPSAPEGISRVGSSTSSWCSR
jgi:hypothetical protein